MSKVITPIIILSLLFGTVSFAQETGLPNPGLTPDSPFYFFDTLAEKISLLFTFDTVKKAEKAFQYAGEKLAEVKVMAEANKVEALKKAGQKYQEYLSLFFEKGGEAHEAGMDIAELTEKWKRRSLDYLIILSDTHERISEEEAKAEIDNLRNVSRKFFGETIWSVHEERMKELREEKIREELKKEIEILKKEESKASEKVAKVDTTNWRTYKNGKFGFAIKYPQDWTKKETTEGTGFTSPKKDASLTVAIVDISVHSDIPVTLQEHKQYVAEQCKVPNCEIIAFSDTTLANNPAYKVVYTMEASEHPSAIFMGVLSIKHNQFYALLYESLEYSKYLDIVNAIIDSFEIM